MLKKLGAFLILAVLTSLSTWLVSTFHLPIPAAIVGLLILFLALLLLGKVPESLNWISQLLLRNLSLFFVPATVAVVLFKEQLLAHGWIILLTLVLSTLVSLFITAWVSQKMLNGVTNARR